MKQLTPITYVPYIILLGTIFVYTLYAHFSWFSQIRDPKKKRIFSAMMLGQVCWVLSAGVEEKYRLLLIPLGLGLSLQGIFDRGEGGPPWKLAMKIPVLLPLVAYQISFYPQFKGFLEMGVLVGSAFFLRKSSVLFMRNYLLFVIFFPFYYFGPSLLGIIAFIGLYLTHGVYFAKCRLEELLSSS